MLYQTELIHIRCNFQLPSHLLDTDFISKIVFMCAFHFNPLIFVVSYVSVFIGNLPSFPIQDHFPWLSLSFLIVYYPIV